MAWLAGAAEERMQRASSVKVQDAPTGEAGPLVCPNLNSARKKGWLADLTPAYLHRVAWATSCPEG